MENGEKKTAILAINMSGATGWDKDIFELLEKCFAGQRQDVDPNNILRGKLRIMRKYKQFYYELMSCIYNDIIEIGNDVSYFPVCAMPVSRDKKGQLYINFIPSNKNENFEKILQNFPLQKYTKAEFGEFKIKTARLVQLSESIIKRIPKFSIFRFGRNGHIEEPIARGWKKADLEEINHTADIIDGKYVKYGRMPLIDLNSLQDVIDKRLPEILGGKRITKERVFNEIKQNEKEFALKAVDELLTRHKIRNKKTFIHEGERFSQITSERKWAIRKILKFLGHKTALFASKQDIDDIFRKIEEEYRKTIASHSKKIEAEPGQAAAPRPIQNSIAVKKNGNQLQFSSPVNMILRKVTDEIGGKLFALYPNTPNFVGADIVEKSAEKIFGDKARVDFCNFYNFLMNADLKEKLQMETRPDPEDLGNWYLDELRRKLKNVLMP